MATRVLFFIVVLFAVMTSRWAIERGGTTEMTGRELLGKGVSITIKDQSGAAILIYQKKS